MQYNGGNVLEGKYNCLSKSQAGVGMDTINVELLNKMVPIGADYVHRHESGTARDGYNAPTLVGASNKSAAPIKSFVIYRPPCITTLQFLSHSKPLAILNLFRISRISNTSSISFSMVLFQNLLPSTSCAILIGVYIIFFNHNLNSLK